MRLVMVNHTFPPASWAGSEICVLRTAQELQRRGHEVFVFVREHASDREEYAMRQDVVEGVPVTRINKTFRYTPDFDSIYRDDFLAARFGDWVGRLQPDLVHFHHLTNLSTTLTHELYIRGIPSIMTLHDYWLHCQRGQLLTRNLKRCDGPSIAGCRDCLAVQTLRGKGQRLVDGFMHRQRQLERGPADWLDLIRVNPFSINTPDARFVNRFDVEIAGDSRTVLMMHPPCTVRYVLRLGTTPRLETAYAMFPATYHQPGWGVRFSIRVEGEMVLDEVVNAKRNAAHRTWFETTLDLHPWAGKSITLELQTAPEHGTDNQYCAAGWGRLRITGLETPESRERAAGFTWKRRFLSGGLNWAARAAAAVFPSATYAIRRRRLAVNDVLNQVDHFISPSQFLRQFFIRQGLEPDRITFLDNGFERTEPVAVRNRKPGEPLRFGYLGTWIPSKGVHLLVEAFNGLPVGPAELHVHGFFPGYDGYETYEYELRAAARHPGIVFHGPYPPARGPELLAELDALVVPSIWWENSPLTIHEAFAARVPVIAADAGGMAEFVQHGVSGLLFRHRDAESLRAVLRRVVDEPVILDHLRKNAPSVLSIQEHTDRLISLYKRIVDGKKHVWDLPVEVVFDPEQSGAHPSP